MNLQSLIQAWETVPCVISAVLCVENVAWGYVTNLFIYLGLITVIYSTTSPTEDPLKVLIHAYETSHIQKRIVGLSSAWLYSIVATCVYT